MEKKRNERPSRRGISLGTIFMLAVTVIVVGLSAATLPRLLGKADFDMDVGSVFALSLDHAIPSLALSQIPISDRTAEPAVQMTPEMPEILFTPAPTAVPTPTPVPGGTVTLTLGGSVNIEEGIRKSAYYSDSGKYDFTEIMMLLQEEMQSDLTLLTLENVTCDTEKVSSVNVPSDVMDMLSDAGVDLLALGYPNAMDKGMAGMQSTVQAARDRGMMTLGAYVNQADADTLRMVTVDNVDVAFLHYTESISSTGKKAVSSEGADYALPMTLISGTPDAMLADIRNAGGWGGSGDRVPELGQGQRIQTHGSPEGAGAAAGRCRRGRHCRRRDKGCSAGQLADGKGYERIDPAGALRLEFGQPDQ